MEDKKCECENSFTIPTGKFCCNCGNPVEELKYSRDEMLTDISIELIVNKLSYNYSCSPKLYMKKGAKIMRDYIKQNYDIKKKRHE